MDGAMSMMSGDHIWKPNRPCAKFVAKSTASGSTYSIFLPPPASVFFRLLPPASAVSRLLPFRAASGPFGSWQHVWGPGWRRRESISGNPTGHVPNFRRKSPDASSVCAIFCFRQLPSASVGFRYRPSASVSGRIWSVRLMETWIGPG